MGLALADVYRIINYKQSSTSRLKELINNARSSGKRTKQKNVSSGQEKPVFFPKKRIRGNNVTITLRWYNYDHYKKRYAQVKSLKGGGRRSFICSRNDTMHDVKEKIRTVFFPNGTSKDGRKLPDYDYCLADFALVELHNETVTVQEYIDTNSLDNVPKVLHMLTKKKRKFSFIDYSGDNSSEYDFAPVKKKTDYQVYSASSIFIVMKSGFNNAWFCSSVLVIATYLLLLLSKMMFQ